MGVSEVLELSEVEVLKPQSDEVQVKVHFTGLNFAEILMRQGLYQDAPPLPFIPGYEWCGEIIALGDSVSGFELWRNCFWWKSVWFSSRGNKYKFKICFKKAESLTPEEMAGAPVSMMTAFASVVEMGGLRSHHHLLVDCGRED